MREELEKAIGGQLRLLAIRTRNTLKIIQKGMTEKLCMSETSYSDIETGKFHCSMLTCVLLICMQSDTHEFFDTVRGICEERQKYLLFDEKEVQPL